MKACLHVMKHSADRVTETVNFKIELSYSERVLLKIFRDIIRKLRREINLLLAPLKERQAVQLC